MYKLNSANGEPTPVSAAGRPSCSWPAILRRHRRPPPAPVGGAARHGSALRSSTRSPHAGQRQHQHRRVLSLRHRYRRKNRVWLPGWGLGAVACRYDHATQSPGRSSASPRPRAVSAPPSTWGRGIGCRRGGGVRNAMSGWLAQRRGAAIRFDAETGRSSPRWVAVHRHDRRDHHGEHRRGPRRRRPPPSTTTGQRDEGGLSEHRGYRAHRAAARGPVHRNSTSPAGQLRNPQFRAARHLPPRLHGLHDQSTGTLTWDAAAGEHHPAVPVSQHREPSSTPTFAGAPYGPFTTSPVDLVQAGAEGEVRARGVRAHSVDGQSTPVLRGFNIVWACAGTIN